MPIFLDLVVVFVIFGGVLLFMSEWGPGAELATGFLAAAIIVVLLHNSASVQAWSSKVLSPLGGTPTAPKAA